MSWPVFSFAVLLAVTLIGSACLVLVFVYWSRVGSAAGDTWVKLLAKLIQAPSLFASICGAFEVADRKAEWLPAVVTGVCCTLIWEAITLLVDNRVKATERTAALDFQRVELESARRTKLLSVFRDSVNEKVKRLIRLERRRQGKAELRLLRSALTPDTHLDDLLQALALFFSEQMPPGPGANRNVRVGLYGDVNGCMTPVRAVNLNNPAYDVFQSYRNNQAAFRVADAERPSHVVTCVRRRETIIVEDCVAAAERGEFFFFHDDQRGYLRSMVAYYLDSVPWPGGTTIKAALVVDTDLAGFFRSADRDSLEFSLREFGFRIKLELLLEAALASRNTNHAAADPVGEGGEGGEAGPATPETP